MFVEGEFLLPNARIVSVQRHLRWELRVEATHSTLFDIEIQPVATAVPHAVVAGEWSVAWRSGPGADETLGLQICEAVGARIATLAMDSRSEPAGEGVRERYPAVVSTVGKVRHVHGGRILTPAGGSLDPFWALEPYVGCLVGCRFCYAQTRLQPWRKGSQEAAPEWGAWVDVRVDAAESLSRDLNDLPPLPVKFTPVRADPYQAIEAKMRVTRACLEILAQRPPPATVVLTRCALVRRDLGLMATIEGMKLGFSMPTMDDQVRQHFEPRACPTHERFDILREASDLGIETFAVVQPMLPGKSERLADLLAANVDSVSLDTLHGVHGAGHDFAAAGFRYAADPTWQQDRLAEMVALLMERDVPIWKGELPPDLGVR